MDIHYSMNHHTYVVTQFSYKLIYMYTLCEILCNFQNSRLLFFFWMVILYINYVHRGEKVLFWYTFELATYIFNSDNIHLYRLIFLFLPLFLSLSLSISFWLYIRPPVHVEFKKNFYAVWIKSLIILHYFWGLGNLKCLPWCLSGKALEIYLLCVDCI